MYSLGFVLILSLFASFNVVASNNNDKKLQTLILLNDDFSKYTYSTFFKSLKRRGHKLQIRSVTEKNIKIEQFGEFTYQNIILIAPKAKKVGDLSYKDFLQFIDKGGNLFVAVDNTASDFMKKIADRSGIILHDKNSQVRDHVLYDTMKGNINNDVVVIDNFDSVPDGVIPNDEKDKINPILYSGIGFSFKSKSHLTLSLLAGSSSTYSTKVDQNQDVGPPEKTIISSGRQLSLIAGLQLRNNARVVFIGSPKMLSDEYLLSDVHLPVSKKKKNVPVNSGNKEFLHWISSWVFGERSILRAINVHHFKVDDPYHTLNPTRYRISDSIGYEADLQQYKWECDCWVPFIAEDVQFEFIRLDPFIRTVLQHDSEGKGHYSLKFQVPDVMGVYKFTIDYQRYGYSHLFSELLVSVRPFRHDEYQRFLTIAYPYYAGCFSMVIGFILFTFIFLFGKKKQKLIWRDPPNTKYKTK